MLKTVLFWLLSLSILTSTLRNNAEPMSSLPADFVETQITGNGLSNTTAMALHPDGRIFVCQQTGQLRVIKNNVVLTTPFITLNVNSSGERGLLGVTFDPNYATNRFVYVYYTATTPTIHNRVSRQRRRRGSRQRSRPPRSGDSQCDQPQRRCNPFWS
jgi:glucose/arabinose dehydrogenase